MADNDISVDEFVRMKVLPELRPVVARVRELVRECAPDAHEVMSYGIPMFKRNKVLAVVSPTKKDITVAFSRGAEFRDEPGLLSGVGKVSKHVKIKSLDTLDEDALRFYIAQALVLDGD